LKGLRFQGESAVREREFSRKPLNERFLDVRVTVYNEDEGIRSVLYGLIPIHIRVYRSALMHSPAAWDERVAARQRIQKGEMLPFYVLVAMRADLATGESLSPPQFSVAIPVRAILGDSLPAGRYSVVATLSLEPLDGQRAGRSNNISVPAGTVFLSN